MADQKGRSAVKTALHIDEPTQYDVVMLNDDFTTMDFVVDVLTHIFYLSKSQAEAVMLMIHHMGQAVVGTYTYDMATSLASQAQSQARAQGFPLRVKVERHEQ